MKRIHDQLNAFLDDELGEQARDEFLDHLSECAECRAGLHDALQLRALHEAAEAGSVPSAANQPIPRSWRPGWSIGGGTVVLLAAAAALFLLWPQPPEAVDFALDADRPLLARLSDPRADIYRPYGVQRDGVALDHVPYAVLARLEETEDWRGLAAALVLGGETERARETLAKLGDDPGAYVDLAAIALLDGRPEDALIAADKALQLEPTNAAALWNRGLALDAMGLDLVAAGAFEAVTEVEDDGEWRMEAQRRRQGLAQRQHDATSQYRQLRDALDAFEMGGPAPTADMVRRSPALTTASVYEAVRRASTTERLAELATVAEALEPLTNTGGLAAQVAHAREGLGAGRGQLVRRYSEAIGADRGSDPAVDDALVERALATGDVDLAVGLLSRGASVEPHLERLDRLAHEHTNEWHRLAIVELLSDRAMLARRWSHARELIDPEMLGCVVDFRCMKLEFSAAHIATEYGDDNRARMLASRGLARARADGNTRWELIFFGERAGLARRQDDIEVERLAEIAAFSNESLLRWPACENARFTREALAMMYMHKGRFDEARRQLDLYDRRVASGECEPEPPRDVGRPYTESYLLQFQGSTQAVSAVRADIASRRRLDRGPGHRAMLDVAEGRLLVQRQPEVGVDLLRRAIDAADAAEDADADPYFSQARAFAYGILIEDAARRQQFARALELMAEERGLVTPGRCVVGLSQDRGLAVVGRTSRGDVIGSFQEGRPELAANGSGPVPSSIAHSVVDCDVVDVIARAPFHGLPGLLPAEVAWRHVVTPVPTDLEELGDTRLIVSGVTPPPQLGLPPLGDHPTPARDHVTYLQGAAATPRRVLSELASADRIEIHAHGIFSPAVSESALLALSPDTDGAFALTAEAVADLELPRRPVVLLGACDAARTTQRLAGPSPTLALAFLEAGARSVVASPAPIEDGDANRFFDTLSVRIASGVEPAVALRDARVQQVHKDHWIHQVVVFE